MKKTILGLAIIALGTTAFNASAQNQRTNNNAQKKERTCCTNDNKGNKKCANPFEGLTLTDAQKTSLNQLNERRRTQSREKSQERKQCSDSLRKASRKAYLDEVKSIIGPEQYVVFLENVYVNGPGMQQQKGMRHNHDGKHKKGNRQNCQGNKCTQASANNSGNAK